MGSHKDEWRCTPPTLSLTHFSTDRRIVEILNDKRRAAGGAAVARNALSEEWQELIKAAVINQLFVSRNTPEHILNSIARPLRVLATCAESTRPWTITSRDAERAFATANAAQQSGKLADLVFGVVKTIIDLNHLTDCGPLSPTLTRKREFRGKRAAYAKASSSLSSDLSARKRAERLPSARAFWELVRIVFTERPGSFLDFLRFAQVKIMFLTGLRVGETAILPLDWKRQRDYFDASGRAAGELGGCSRSLMLRHFAEKQRGPNEDSTVLYEATQHIPLKFERILSETLDQVVKATEPLRRTMRAQCESGRMLPEFPEDALIPATDLYPHLSGNPFTYITDQSAVCGYASRYQADYDPRIFDEIRSDQAERRLVRRKLNIAANQFFLRLDRSLLRRPDGSECGPGYVNWGSAHLLIKDIEEHYKVNVPTKLSDLVPLKLGVGKGSQLQVHELLFLMPKRALAEGREGGLCDITRYFSVGRMDAGMMTKCLCSPSHGTLFEKYGETDEDRRLTLNPHSLRHLQNGELFRLGIADTIITKRFNRKSIAQSYEYDHRNLSEELDQLELPEDVETLLGTNAATVARMIKAGRAQGPIVSSFLKIQETQGDDAAFEYLRVEADGFHSTPYGHCLNSFTVDPCPKHLECFSGCRHLSATNLPENRQNLVRLESRFLSAIESIKKRSSMSIGLANQLAHAQSRLEGVQKLLATPTGQRAFPEGPDLSLRPGQNQESILDSVKI